MRVSGGEFAFKGALSFLRHTCGFTGWLCRRFVIWSSAKHASHAGQNLEDSFQQISDAAARAFDGVKYTCSYPAGAMLFLEGQQPDGVFLLCRGRVKLSMTAAMPDLSSSESPNRAT